MTFDAVLVAWLKNGAGLECLHRFVVFLLHLMTGAFAGPSFDKLRVEFDRMLGVF
jgi:hypothetical protein